MATEIEYDKDFGELLEATTNLLHWSQTIKQRSISQAVVLFSTLLLEAAANCCLMSLKLPSSFYNDLDKLPTMSKFDFYLFTRSGGKRAIDRGAKYAQEAADLKVLRDCTVHPKRSRVVWTDITDTERQGEKDVTARLKICRAMDGWTVQDALTCFRVANTFLEHFLLVDCKLTQRESKIILLAPIDELEPVTEISWHPDSDSLEYAARTWKIPLRYVGIRPRKACDRALREAGNSSNGISRVIGASRSPSPDPR
jgi:hypothetical protein